MRKKVTHDDGLLRQKAEERLKQGVSLPVNPSTLEMERLIHELQVHQIELEAQNDQLRTALARLEASAESNAALRLEPIEHKPAEEQLERERSLIDVVTESIGVGLAIISKDYQTVWANKVVKDIFGEVEGKACYATYNQRDDICPACGVREVFEEARDRVVHEQVGKDCNGQEIWSQIVATPIKNSQGEIISALEMVRPITEEKLAQFQLKESHETLLTVLESLNAIVYAADIKTHEILYANRHTREIFGDIEGKVCWQAIQADQTGPCSFCNNDRILTADGKTAGVHTWEFQNTINGHWYLIYDQAIIWTDGRLARLEIATDMTEQKQTADALKESEEKFRGVFQLSPDGLELFDANGRLIDFNQAVVDIFGVVEPQQLIGFNLFQDPNLPSEVKARVLAGEVVRYEREFVFDLIRSERLYETTRTGSLLLDIVISPLSRTGSTPDGFLVQLRDATGKKKMEEELFKLKKLEATGILAGGMAHDFNNLLSIILGNISVAGLDLPPGHPTETLDNAEKAARRAKDLTDKFVIFAGSGTPLKKTMDLKKLLEDSAELALSGSNIRWRSSFSPDLWPATVDEGQLRQAVTNVIINAREAMPEGGTVLILALNTKITAADKDPFPVMGEGRYVKISIQDRGVGIPEKFLEKILDPYFSTKGRGSEKGMGFGLAITHSVIKRHGGHIDVKSERGRGTTVDLYLPASPPTYDAATLRTEENLRQPKRILVLEDEEMMLACVNVMLRRLGHEMEGARNGEEATQMYLEAYQQGRPFDLVILDITIKGGMGGKETILILRKIDPYVKAIVSSGYSQDPIMAAYKEYGFDDALPKPYAITDLEGVLQKLFEQ